MNLFKKNRLTVLCGILSAILIMLPCIPMTGCTPAQILKVVQNVESVAQGVQANLPAANALLTDLQTLDPEAYEFVKPVVDAAPVGIQKVIAACENYKSNPGDDNYQALLNLVDALTSQVDQAALKLAGIKNPDSKTKAVAGIAMFSTGLHISLGLLEANASSKQKTAVPAHPAVAWNQVKPFIDRNYAVKVLDGLGYDGEQCLKAAGL